MCFTVRTIITPRPRGGLVFYAGNRIRRRIHNLENDYFRNSSSGAEGSEGQRMGVISDMSATDTVQLTLGPFALMTSADCDIR